MKRLYINDDLAATFKAHCPPKAMNATAEKALLAWMAKGKRCRHDVPVSEWCEKCEGPKPEGCE